MSKLMDRRTVLGGIGLGVLQAVVARVSRGAAAAKSAPGVKNVRDYGAQGTGQVDDAPALNTAARALRDGDTLLVPAGTYLVDSAAWLIRGRSRIKIQGEGDATRLIVSDQNDSNPQKQDYHSTLVIDQCTGVEIADMVVESRGANYGNTDAYGSRSYGDDRARAIIDCGGCALVVLRSSDVTVSKVKARRTGSVGVFYFSCCQELVARDCFANARSLGYAGFAVDNWVDYRVNGRRTYSFLNCTVAKEDANYSSKGGIVAEGDRGMPLTITVDGGKYSDGATGGGNAQVAGTGISIFDCNATIKNVTTENCYIGLRLNKRGGAIDHHAWHVSNCSMLGNRVAGIYLAVGNAAGGGDYLIEGVTIRSGKTSVWWRTALEAVKVSSGIVHDGYMEGAVRITGADIAGAQYGILATGKSQFTIDGGNIEASVNGIALYGGGTNRISGVTIKTSAPGSSPVLVSTSNKSQTASSTSSLVVSGCTLDIDNAVPGDVALKLTGNSRLFASTEITNNRIGHGTISAPRGAATTYQVE